MSTIQATTVEPEVEPERCLNANVECAGPVELHWTGSSTKAWPRCDFHQALRQDAYENSMERYADSSVAPSWFSEADAGERWDDE